MIGLEMPNNTFTPSELLSILKSDVKKWGSQKKLAEKMDISLAYINDILLEKRKPGKKVLAFYRLEERVTYVRVGK